MSVYAVYAAYAVYRDRGRGTVRACCIHVYMHTYACLYAYLYMSIYAYLYMSICIPIHVHMHSYTCLYATQEDLMALGA